MNIKMILKWYFVLWLALLSVAWADTVTEPIRTFEGEVGGICMDDCVAFSSDGQFILSANYSQAITLWEVSSGAKIRTFWGHTSSVHSMALSPDDRYVLSGSNDHTIRLWEVSSGAEIRIFQGHTDLVWSVAFSPDGRYALSGSKDNTIKLWEVSSGAVIRTIQGNTGSVWSVAFSPDGRYALSGSEDIKLWEVSSGAEIRSFQGHTDYVYSVAFSPDGRYALSGSLDNTIKVWEVSSGAEIRTFQGHSSGVVSVAFSPDGRYAHSGSWDRTSKLWEVSSGAEIRTFQGHTDAVMSVTFSPDGRYVLSGSNDRTLKLWETGIQNNQPFLHVQGREIVDGNGNPIILRGVNMDNNHWMEGADPMEYATQADIQFLDELGMTVIRVALDWHYFQTSLGYELIDRYLAWCESSGIYAILDMHVVPPDEEFGQNRIWEDPAAQQQFLDLWTAIAARYADNPVVAGYDLYNEPGPHDPMQWWDLAARAVTAVRSVDTNHILFVENPVYPLFSDFRLLDDPNIVYSYHDYTPFVVTHAGADWGTDSPIPDDYAYPGPALEGIEWADWSSDAAVLTDSTSDWLYWDSGVLTPPAGVEFATLKPAVSGNGGRVWFDDLEVLQNGIPQTIYNPGAEEASFVYEGAPANWFFWSETGFTGTWSDEVAHSGTHSLQITGTGNGYGVWGQSNSLLSEPLFPIEPGDTFQVRGWLYAPENNGGSITLGLDYLNGIYTDYNREQLVADIQPYVDWAAANNVPLFVGEFGAMTTSPGDSRYRLVADKVSVMNEANLHWAFWTFRWYGNPEAGYSSLYLDDQLDEPLAEILRVNNDSTFNCEQVTEIPKKECQALIALYESTDGANWENNTGWNVTNTPCSWNGVTCQGKHVTRLSLGNNNLKGSISAKFFKLKNLESLELSDNELNGTSLNKFKKLKSLKTLWLNNCKLSGKIPNSLMKLKKLTELDLNDNCLKTKVSKKLGKWLDEINPGWDDTQTDCLY